MEEGIKNYKKVFNLKKKKKLTNIFLIDYKNLNLLFTTITFFVSSFGLRIFNLNVTILRK